MIKASGSDAKYRTAYVVGLTDADMARLAARDEHIVVLYPPIAGSQPAVVHIVRGENNAAIETMLRKLGVLTDRTVDLGTSGPTVAEQEAAIDKAPRPPERTNGFEG